MQSWTNFPSTYYNINSAIHKAALIQDLMSDHSLDVIALSETRYQRDNPNSILSEVAPNGFTVQHVFRSPTANHPAGGGLAFVHRNNVVIKSVQSGCPTPTSFELQVLRVTSCYPCITIVNAYRPPDRSNATFYDDFQDVISTILASTTDPLLICGDLNEPGFDVTSINPGLHDVIETLELEQLVKSPTRSNPDHILDLIITDDYFTIDHSSRSRHRLRLRF